MIPSVVSILSYFRTMILDIVFAGLTDMPCQAIIMYSDLILIPHYFA